MLQYDHRLEGCIVSFSTILVMILAVSVPRQLSRYVGKTHSKKRGICLSTAKAEVDRALNARLKFDPSVTTDRLDVDKSELDLYTLSPQLMNCEMIYIDLLALRISA